MKGHKESYSKRWIIFQHQLFLIKIQECANILLDQLFSCRDDLNFIYLVTYEVQSHSNVDILLYVCLAFVDSEFRYFPHTNNSLKGTEIILSWIEIVISWSIPAELTQNGFFVLPSSLIIDSQGKKKINDFLSNPAKLKIIFRTCAAIQIRRPSKRLRSFLRELQLMGFKDKVKNIRILKEVNGDVDSAIQKLCSE